MVMHRDVDADQTTLLLGKVLLVVSIMVELDRVREQSGKGGLILHTCTIYGDASVTRTSRDLLLVLVVLIFESRHTGTYRYCTA